MTVYQCSICGHRTDEGEEHTWGQTMKHFSRELIGGERMELIPVKDGKDRS